MSHEKPTVLLEHYLKELKLPTVLPALRDEDDHVTHQRLVDTGFGFERCEHAGDHRIRGEGVRARRLQIQHDGQAG